MLYIPINPMPQDDPRPARLGDEVGSFGGDVAAPITLTVLGMPVAIDWPTPDDA
jgi:hypothetical protein